MTTVSRGVSHVGAATSAMVYQHVPLSTSMVSSTTSTLTTITVAVQSAFTTKISDSELVNSNPDVKFLMVGVAHPATIVKNSTSFLNTESARKLRTRPSLIIIWPKDNWSKQPVLGGNSSLLTVYNKLAGLLELASYQCRHHCQQARQGSQDQQHHVSLLPTSSTEMAMSAEVPLWVESIKC